MVALPGQLFYSETHEEEAEPIDEKIKRLVPSLREQQVEAVLDAAITASLKELGYVA